ncbi:MAG: hypothetical protein HY259_03385, partial [Chloroflexi bacterium]|nr:hypothetical protein [Chloroflexota bacterium]
MNSHKPLQKLRVFVAFPSDVATERARLGTVIEELKPFAEMVGVALELLDWQGVIPDLGNAEDVILEQLKPTTWDVFIGILWHRFGSPTKRTDPQSGKPYLSGTEQEFRIAYRLWQRYKRPRMMFFWCKAAIPPDTLDLEQYRLVKDFFAGFAPGADHPGLYQTYENAAAFEPLVRRSLTNYLIQYAEQVKGRTLSTQEVESFAPRAHDSLPRRAPFFGRRNETATALRALSPDDRGWGLVIDGIGGIGKTALAVEVAYLCKERGLFDTFVFATAKTLRLEPSGIKDQALAETTLDGLISEAARVLGHANIVDLAGGEPKQRALMAALHGKRTLLIFDNLESLNITEQNRIGDFLRYLPDGSKAIVTSRRRPGESAVILHLEPLTWDEARELIADQVARNPNVQIAFAKVGETAWKQLYDEAGGSPLAMVWTIGLIQSKRLSFGRALAMVRDGSMANALTAFIYRESRKTMDVHEWSVLSALSLFEGPATFDALAAISHLERRPLDSVLSRLNALSLVDTDGVDGASGEERYTMHPMTRRFARTEMALDAQSAHATGLRFARYWAEYAQRFGGDQADGHTAHHQLESEWPNLDGALNWLWQTAGLKGDVAEDKAAARL